MEHICRYTLGTFIKKWEISIRELLAVLNALLHFEIYIGPAW